LKIAWDIDHTLLLSKKEVQPTTIMVDDDPYLNPVVIGRENEISILVTGRPYIKWRDTHDLLLALGLTKIQQICLNPVNKFDQHHIATIKSKYLTELGITHYIEDNPKYREVMRRYWDGICIGSDEWVVL
jgi:hypothetical protein